MTLDTNRFHFTQARLNAVTCPPSGRPQLDGKQWVYDEETPGLVFCMTEKGSRSFYFYRRVPGMTAPKRAKLGDYPETKITEARRMAAAMNLQLQAGETPQSPAEKLRRENSAKEGAPTLANLWASYCDHHLNEKRQRTVSEFTRYYNKYLAKWAERPLDSITARDVETLKTTIGGKSKYTANRVIELLSAMYRRRGHAFGLARKYTPTDGVEPYPEKARDRVLTVEELAKVISVIDAEGNTTIRDYFKMLLYTGQRKMTVARMAWDDLNIDGGTWKIPGEKTKNGKPLVVTLADEAMAIIKSRYESNPEDSPYVFPAKFVTPKQAKAIRDQHAAGKTTREIAAELNLSQTGVMKALAPGFTPKPPSSFGGAGKAWGRILESAGITQSTTIHDIRRTFCTMMIERGVSLPVVSAAMGHRSMATTQRHYAFASDKAVAEATRANVTGLLADVARVRETAGKKQVKGGA